MKSQTFWTGFILLLLLAASGFMYKTVQVNQEKASILSKHSDTFNMKDYKGKVVVMNYWASWSKISRTENKQISRIYQSYRINPKIVFVSVSLDTEEAAWKTAIEEDELIWKEQYCDFKKYDSPMAKKYNVSTLPKFFLFNASGAQIASYSNTRDLEAAIQNALN